MEKYNFKNLVFEGGGVKAIAYIGALESIEKKDILPNIERVAGTSAGAIIAALLSVGYSSKEIYDLFIKTDFSLFKDESPLFFPNIFRLLNRYGWYKGRELKKWLINAIKKKTDPNITFKQLSEQNIPNKKDLYVIGSNVNKKEEAVFSSETSPNMRIVDAVRISMSIPLFFKSIREEDSIFVDGGIYYNYPLDLFDHGKYIGKKGMKRIYNKETLGFRVDTLEEASEQAKRHSNRIMINSFKEYLSALIGGLVDAANKRHLKEKDWHRTVFINSLEVSSTNFEISTMVKNDLIESGKKGVSDYFRWYDNSSKEEKPLNK